MSVGTRNAYASVQEVHLRTMELLRVTRLQASTTDVMEVDDNGNFVTREVESCTGIAAVPEPFRHGALSLFEGGGLVRSLFTKRELPPSDLGTGPVYKKNRVVSLPPTALLLMVSVKVEDVVAKNPNGIGVKLSSAGRDAYGELQIDMMYVCMLYFVPFQRLLEAVEQSGKDISEGVYAVICDPLYNSCWTAELSVWSMMG